MKTTNSGLPCLGYAIGIAMGFIVAFGTAWAQTTPALFETVGRADAAQGEAVFRQKGCFDCHSYDGWGGMFGPDLGTQRIRGTSPSSLAAAMWNQAPAMWRNIKGQIPSLSYDEAAALYAFFYSRLYFNDYADTPHGEDYFKSNCSSCHNLEATNGRTKAGPPVSEWGSIKDPMVLAGKMWNHATAMLDRSNREGKSWPRLSGQDLVDLLGYFWRQPSIVPVISPFQFGDDRVGERLFVSRCSECHIIGQSSDGKVDLNRKLRKRTLPEIAAALWNHAPKMKLRKLGVPLPALTETEIRDLLTFLVIRPVFNETGRPVEGSVVFQNRKCIDCHGEHATGNGAPPVSSFKGTFDAIRMTTILWSHGPTMLGRMKTSRIPWPRFTSAEMLDLIAYLNRKAGR